MCHISCKIFVPIFKAFLTALANVGGEKLGRRVTAVRDSCNAVSSCMMRSTVKVVVEEDGASMSNTDE